MNEVRIELPFPPPQLSPNARVHWREKAKVVAEYRETVAWWGVVKWRKSDDRLIVQRGPLTPPVRATVTFVVPTRRRRDEQNLLAMLKPAWDGLCDAGVLVGDDASVFKVERTEIGWRSDAEPKVIVELRSL